MTRPAITLAVVSVVAVTAGVAGCGTEETPSGSTARPVDLDGVYRYEVSTDYLVQRGVPRAQAREESGVHTLTLDGGEFTDAWRNARSSGECAGTYEIVGDEVTFLWTRQCVGDWKMTFTREGQRLKWSNIRSLPPHNDPESQRINEAFNSVPWLKIG